MSVPSGLLRHVVLEEAAVAVRLRRLWLGVILPSPELAESSLAPVWQDLDLILTGQTLTIVGPPSGQDALHQPVAELLQSQAAKVTADAVTTLGWRSSRRLQLLRREKSTNLDVFHVDDPLLDQYAGVLDDLRAAIPDGIGPDARAALRGLRLVGASRHRLWFAAPNASARNALGTVPGARAALFTTVQRVQRAKRPLLHIVVDPSYRAKAVLL